MTMASEQRETLTLVFVWLACMALLIATVAASLSHLGPIKPVLSLLIATTKAGLILWFFMHLREVTGLVRLFALGALFWLAIMFGLTINDYATRDLRDTAVHGQTSFTPESR
jgi:cytochrome c oxidase subunit 4